MAHVEESHPPRVVEFIDVLHRVVGLPFDTDTNRWFMGIIATLYSMALVSGVIVLLPTLVKDLFALRPGKNLKRMWLDAHNAVGVVSLPFHVVMALTATVFAFHDGIYLLQNKIIHDGKLSWDTGRPVMAKAAPHDPASMLPPAELVPRAQALSPTFEPATLQYSQVTAPQAAVRVWGRDATDIARRPNGGFVVLDPYTGEVMSTEYLPGRQDAANTTITSFFALHFGTFGGSPVQWMYFLLALAGAWLFYSGNLLWIETRRKTQRKNGDLPAQRRDTYFLTAGSVGICLGCICGISLMLVAGKWLPDRMSATYPVHQYVYYTAFFTCIAWAFLRGGARASVDLLSLAAAATLAIPVTTLLTWGFSSQDIRENTHSAALGVDLIAFVGGLCYAGMAQATARRVRRGPQDSVWSARSGPKEPDIEASTTQQG